ncbi:Outer membrane protein assembly factor BamB [subsurface metagenome]
MKRTILIITWICLAITACGQTGRSDWSLYRGRSDLSGRTDTPIPSNPRLLWSVRTGSRTVSSPVFSNGVVYFGNNDGILHAVSSDGRILWKYEVETSIEAPPIIVNNKVIFGSLDGELRAIDPSTGKLVWLYKAGNQIIGSANIWENNNRKLIIVGSYDFYLHCVDPENGEPVWKLETYDFINGTPAIIRGKIIFGGCDGFLRVVEPISGKEEKHADLGVYIASSPALSGNQAFVGSYEGIFYAINLTTMDIDWQIPGRDEYSVIMVSYSFISWLVMYSSFTTAL